VATIATVAVLNRGAASGRDHRTEPALAAATLAPPITLAATTALANDSQLAIARVARAVSQRHRRLRPRRHASRPHQARAVTTRSTPSTAARTTSTVSTTPPAVNPAVDDTPTSTPSSGQGSTAGTYTHNYSQPASQSSPSPPAFGEGGVLGAGHAG
jgi:hypothetical protein